MRDGTGRATRRARLLALATVMLLAVACGADATRADTVRDDAPPPPGVPSPARPTTAAATPSGWSRLPDPPLNERVDAGLVALDDHRAVVLGGSGAACPPTAACAGPPDPGLDDAALLDLSTGIWRALPAMPVGVPTPRAVAVGDLVYVLGTCLDPERCAHPPALLRLDLATESWTSFPAPDAEGYGRLVALGDRVVHVIDSDESGEVPDEVFDPATGTWTALPDDPLPDSFDRFALARDGDLYLFGSPIGGSGGTTSTKIAAVYGAERDAWADLPESGRPGFQVWDVGDHLVLNGHFSPDHGGLFDPTTEMWSDVPAPPEDPSWRGDMAGAVGDDTAAYAGTDGWILDVTTRSWIDVPPRPGDDAVRDQEAVTAVGRALVVVGGAHWPAGGGGALLHEAWVWTPPGA